MLCKIMNSIYNDCIYLLDMCCRITAGISKLADFICNNCKSFADFTCSCSLNSGIECKEIGLLCYAEDIISKSVYLVYTVTVFNCGLKYIKNLSNLCFSCMHICGCSIFNFFSMTFHIFRVVADFNSSLSYSIYFIVNSSHIIIYCVCIHTYICHCS